MQKAERKKNKDTKHNFMVKDVVIEDKTQRQTNALGTLDMNEFSFLLISIYVKFQMGAEVSVYTFIDEAVFWVLQRALSMVLIYRGGN